MAVILFPFSEGAERLQAFDLGCRQAQQAAVDFLVVLPQQGRR